MKKIFAMVLLFAAGIMSAQQEAGISLVRIKDNIYRLTSQIPYQVNFLAFVTGDGILLVDAGQKETGAELKKVLKSIANGNEKVKYLINTHQHIDHTGGNLALAGEPVIIGTELLKSKMRSGPLVLNEFPDNAVPQRIFSDSTIIEFGGEKIRIISLPGAHDNSDVIVHFVKSGVVCTGDIAFGMVFPSIDAFTGSILKYPEVINKLLKLVPSNVTFITGHGREMNYEEMKAYRDMFINSIAIVQKEMANGKKYQEMVQQNILKDYGSFDGQMVKRPVMIYNIATAGQNKITGSTIEELYRVLVKADAQEAVKKYYELKTNFPGKYFFGESPLTSVGYWLLDKGRVKDAIGIFELYVKEFPNSWNSYDSLGEAYMAAGEKEKAIVSYEKSLQLNPESETGKEQLKKLKAGK